MAKISPMFGINGYYQELTAEEIRQKYHRYFVGDKWDEIGRLQYDFLINRGLHKTQRLLDIGCGCLRGGLHFIRYLEPGNYFGLDINASLINAGWQEIKEARLEYMRPTLVVDDRFRFSQFNVKFDYMISVSLFTHLPPDFVSLCLENAGKTLVSGGHYYSTYFEAPEATCFGPLIHPPENIETYCNKDPYHYSFNELEKMADSAGLRVIRIGDWGHPRGQKMALFFR